MEVFSINVSGVARTEMLNGREYLVAPMRLIVPGVLNGSSGPLYYPPDEVSRNVDSWNGMPITRYHPSDASGKPTSARHPSIMNLQSIGFVYNAVFAETLDAEGWFDTELTRKKAPEIYAKLRANQSFELSTGLYTRNDPISGTYNGKSYTHIARDYRPDHLAVLPDQMGACSLKDGCGVMVNTGTPLLSLNSDGTIEWPSSTSLKYNRDWSKEERDKLSAEDFAGPHQSFPIKTQEDVDSAAHLVGKAADPAAVKARIIAIAKRKGLKVPEAWTGNSTPYASSVSTPITVTLEGTIMNRTDLIKWLTTNCDCWKSTGDAETLNKLTDEKLKELKASSEKAKGVADALAISDIAFKEALAKVEELKVNAAKTPTPAPIPTPTSPTPPVPPKTMEEWMAVLPPPVQETIRNAHNIVQVQKKALVDKLTANVSDAALKTKKVEKLMNMRLEDVQDLYDLLPPPVTPTPSPTSNFSPGFFGLAGGGSTPSTNPDTKVEGGSLPIPVINYEDFASPGLVEKLGRRKIAN